MRMKDLVGKEKKVMNVYGFLGRITLDIIGQSELPFLSLSCYGILIVTGAFRYEFNALDDGQDELLEILNHLLFVPISLACSQTMFDHVVATIFHAKRHTHISPTGSGRGFHRYSIRCRA